MATVRNSVLTAVMAGVLILGVSGCSELELTLNDDGDLETEAVQDDTFVVISLASPDLLEYVADGDTEPLITVARDAIAAYVANWDPADQVVLDYYEGDLDCFEDPIRQGGTPTSDDGSYCADVVELNRLEGELDALITASDLWFVDDYEIADGGTLIVSLPIEIDDVDDLSCWRVSILATTLDLEADFSSIEEEFLFLEELSAGLGLIADQVGYLIDCDGDRDTTTGGGARGGGDTTALVTTATLAQTGSPQGALWMGALSVGVLMAAGLGFLLLARRKLAPH